MVLIVRCLIHTSAGALGVGIRVTGSAPDRTGYTSTDRRPDGPTRQSEYEVIQRAANDGLQPRCVRHTQRQLYHTDQ